MDDGRWKNYCKLETVTKSPDAFIEDFCVNLKTLRQHEYIAKQQTAHLKATKKNLQEGEYVVICNFSENYAFIVQIRFKHIIGPTIKHPCIRLFFTIN
jgi:hypothetical protein